MLLLGLRTRPACDPQRTPWRYARDVRDLLFFLLALLVTWAALFGLGLVLVRWRLARSNRVSPAVKSPAPLHWLCSWSRTARLHRRLRAAVTLIHLSPSPRSRQAPSLSVDALRRDLEYQAVELDQHLVVAARHPRAYRRGLLRSLDQQVVTIEALAVRLSTMMRPLDAPSTGWDAPVAPPDVLQRIGQQLDLLDAAQTELVEIERASGLVDLDALMAETHTPVAVTPRSHPNGR
jgi:hypothetical protein